MKDKHTRQVTEKVRDLFLLGDTRELGKVSAVIRDSWLRSKALGVDPNLSCFPQILSANNIEELFRHSDLFEVGQERVRRMLKVLEDVGDCIRPVSA